MSIPIIAVVNHSTIVSDADVKKWSDAIQIQIARDFEPLWDVSASPIYKLKKDVLPTDWQMIIADTSDQADALGYHETTNSGMPIGYVFAKSNADDHASNSVCLSHEILEMIADPYVNLATQVTNRSFVSYEVCDAVEADELGYEIDGVLVSDFQLPNWFVPGSKGPWSFKRNVIGPLHLAPGGYLCEFISGHGWTQHTHPDKARAHREHPGRLSRRHRRAHRASMEENVVERRKCGIGA